MCNLSLLFLAALSKSSQKCSSSRKHVILLLVNNCYCFRARVVVSVVCSFAFSKGIKPFTRALPDWAATYEAWPEVFWLLPVVPLSTENQTWRIQIDCQFSMYKYFMPCRSREHPEDSHTKCIEVRKLTARNTHLSRRVDELIVERDSALHDSQDLLSGMQVGHLQWVITQIPSNALFTYPNEDCKTAQYYSDNPRSGKTKDFELDRGVTSIKSGILCSLNEVLITDFSFQTFPVV